MVGTAMNSVMSPAAILRAIRAGLSKLVETHRAPEASAQKCIFIRPWMWWTGKTLSILSSLCHCHARWSTSTMLFTLEWVWTTPLGRAVVPEVYTIRQSSCTLGRVSACVCHRLKTLFRLCYTSSASYCNTLSSSSISISNLLPFSSSGLLSTFTPVHELLSLFISWCSFLSCYINYTV